MAGFNIVYLTCAIALASAAGFRIRALLRIPRGPEHRAARATLAAVCVTLAAASQPFVFAAPAVYVRVDELFGVPNLATPIVYSFVVIFAGSAQIMLLYHQYPFGEVWPRARWRVAVILGVLLSMYVLFAVADTTEEHPIDFDAFYATNPAIAAYLVIYLLAFTAGMAGIAHLCRRWATITPRVWLRRGLVIIALAACWALGYSVCKAIAIVARWSGANVDLLGNVVAPMSASVGAILFAVGFSLPAVGPRLAKVRGWMVHFGLHRRLYPLWRAVIEANSGVHMPLPANRVSESLMRFAPYRRLAGRWAVNNLEERLFRRIIEIRDGQLALRRYVDHAALADVRQRAVDAGLTGSELAILLEAAQITLGLAAQGRADPVVTAPEILDVGASDFGDDVIREAAWLSRVAQAVNAS